MTIARTAGLTDPGRRRRRNEDAYVLQPPLFAVADGMGGAQAGEVAARLAADVLREAAAADGGEERVVSLIQAANRRVYERSHADAAVSGMGTTITVALLGRDDVSIGHVGDSRAYLIRGGELEQLTDDHSLVAELMRSGKLSPEEAETHPQRSVITRALGTDPDVDVDTFRVPIRSGDLFLLCSDGLTTMVGDDRILAVVEQNRGDLDAAARALVSTANRVGGEDNITVVFFEIGDEAAAAEPLPPADGAPGADEEDTLSGLERLPAVDTMVVPPEQVAEVFQDVSGGQTPRHGRSGPRRMLAALALVALLAAIAALLLWGLTR